MPCSVTASLKTCAAMVTTASGGDGAWPAWIRAMVPPSLWPTRTGLEIPAAASTFGRTSSASMLW